MNIIEAINDEKLFQPFLGDDLSSWTNWQTAMRVLYGLPIAKSEKRLVKQCTGRKRKLLPSDGFGTGLFLTGRRSGKSRIAAIIGAFEAVLAGHESRLAPGECGVVPIISPSRSQSRIVRDYCRAIFETPMLSGEVVRETAEGFELRNKSRIEILTGDWRLLRGYTLLCAVVDEACFLGYDSDSKVKNDTELIRAVQPALSSVGGKLICISSPYAKRGWCYKQWKQHFGNDGSKTLVWNCGSRVMNPTLPQSVVDQALADDLAAAKAEYLGEFRDDVSNYLPREVIENLIVENRKELLFNERVTYQAFADISGGRNDDAALAVAHKDEGGKIVLDFLKRYRPPHSPQEVIDSMSEELRRYAVRRVTGDNYSAEFVVTAFRHNGIGYLRSKKNKSQLYMELLPRLCSGEIELLDNPLLVDQLANLERRTRSGGKDSVDHPAGSHDDLANVVAGVAVSASTPPLVAGGIRMKGRNRRYVR